jgi:hypothetical protein
MDTDLASYTQDPPANLLRSHHQLEEVDVPFGGGDAHGRACASLGMHICPFWATKGITS